MTVMFVVNRCVRGLFLRFIRRTATKDGSARSEVNVPLCSFSVVPLV